jgi:Protein of unknown function (DUF3761)
VDTRFTWYQLSLFSTYTPDGPSVPSLGVRSRADNLERRILMLRRFASVFALATVLLPSLFAQTPQQSTNQATQQQQNLKPKCTDTGTYVNSHGQTVRRPENCSAAPQGATAQCRDGSYSFSKSRRGTCSRHGGVAKWL